MIHDVIQYMNIHGTLLCKSNAYSCHDHIEPCDLCLHGGFVYGLKGAIGSGNWALSACLSSSISNDALYDRVLYNGKETAAGKAPELVCDIMQYVDRLIGSKCTVDCLIKEAISSNGRSLSENDIIARFKLTKERYHRDITEVGNEIYRIAMAIGFIERKLIFTFPFIGEMDTLLLDITNCCFSFLKANGCIILVPYDRSLNLRHIMDYICTFKRSRIVSVRKAGALPAILHKVSDGIIKAASNMRTKLIILHRRLAHAKMQKHNIS